jgi:hypothetical protein
MKKIQLKITNPHENRGDFYLFELNYEIQSKKEVTTPFFPEMSFT